MMWTAFTAPRHDPPRVVIGALVVGLTCLSGASHLTAQLVQGQVVDLVLGTPISTGVVVLLDRAGSEVSRTTTDERGLFQLMAPGGVYSLRVHGQGYSVSEFPTFELPPEGLVGFRLLVPSVEPGEGAVSGNPAEVETRIGQICRDDDVGGYPVLVGIVRDGATGKPVGEATIVMTWSSVPTQLVGLVRDRVGDTQSAVVTGATGFYSICGLSRGNRINMYAAYEDLTSEVVSLRFDSGGVYVGRRFVPMENRLFRRDLQILPRERHTSSVSGTVTDTAGSGIASAEVHVVGTAYGTHTDVQGRFELTDLPMGSMQVSAEAVGYMPTRILVELTADEELELSTGSFRMTPLPTQLAPIEVEAAAPTSRRDLSDFERRRNRGSGSFVTRTEFMADGEPLKTTDVLRRMGGISVRPGPSARRPWIITSSRVARGGASNQRGVCFPLVFIDEVLVGTTDSYLVDSALPVHQIEAIEFYGSVAAVPHEFNRPGAACGVLIFWTR